MSLVAGEDTEVGASPEPAVLRPLSPLEDGMAAFSEAAPINFTIIARIRGDITADSLAAAVAAVQARHELLRVRIDVDEEGKGRFATDGVPSLPIRRIDGADGRWVEEVGREVGEPFDEGRGPLARVLWLPASDGHRLLVTLHHAIGDGMSGIFLVRDMVAALGSPEVPVPPVPSPRPVDQRLTSAGRGAKLLWGALSLVMRELLCKLRCPRLDKVRRDRDVFAHSRQVRCIPLVIDAEPAAALGRRCRAEGTTVHGALSAAVLRAVMRDSGEVGPASVNFGSPVDLRPRLEPPGGEEVGLSASIVSFRAILPRDIPFWDLARRIRHRMARALALGLDMVMVRLLSVFFRHLASRSIEPRERCERWERAGPTTTGLTNIGRLEVPRVHGSLELRELHFFVSTAALSDFAATAASFGGRIFLNISYPEPLLAPEHARSIADGILEDLREHAVDGAPCR